MAIFSKAMTALTQDDLAELLTDAAVENVRLEFKREMPGKDEMLKKLSSFANTFGGMLVIGAEASSADGRITGLPGIDVQNGFKQTIVQWCFGHVSPPLTVEVSDPIPVPGEAIKVCYVVSVAESDQAPHFINGRKGVYVRTDEFSARFEPRFATEIEMRHLLERRNAVRKRRTSLIKRARNRFETFADQDYGIRASGRRQIGARYDLAILPRFPVKPICDQARLPELLNSYTVSWRSTNFPLRNLNDVISQHESAIILNPSGDFSFLEANLWGMLFFATEIESDRGDLSGMHLYEFVGTLLVFLKYAGQIIRRGAYAGMLRVEMRMKGIRGVKWSHALWGDPDSGPSSVLDDDFAFDLTTDTDELADTPDRVAKNILRVVFFATNWSLVADEDLVRQGYKYNNWHYTSGSE